MLIQVDVDSTLYDADKLFASIAEEAGIKWIKKSPNWFGPEDIGCTLQDLKNIFRKAHSREYVMQQKPYKGAAEVLGQIAETWPVEIAYVSDRNEQQASPLKEWLEANDFLHNPDQRVVVSKDKRQWMLEHRPSVVIDDRVRTMLFSKYELGAQVVSLRHNHNVNLKNEIDGIHIVNDWAEIGELLNVEILPSLTDQLLAFEPYVRS